VEPEVDIAEKVKVTIKVIVLEEEEDIKVKTVEVIMIVKIVRLDAEAALRIVEKQEIEILIMMVEKPPLVMTINKRQILHLESTVKLPRMGLSRQEMSMVKVHYQE